MGLGSAFVEDTWKARTALQSIMASVTTTLAMPFPIVEQAVSASCLYPPEDGFGQSRRVNRSPNLLLTRVMMHESAVNASLYS
jgi:hypothetical protein